MLVYLDVLNVFIRIFYTLEKKKKKNNKGVLQLRRNCSIVKYSIIVKPRQLSFNSASRQFFFSTKAEGAATKPWIKLMHID